MTAKDYAKILRDADTTKKTIKPLRDQGVSDIKTAYEIQNVNTAYRTLQGARIIGKKIGLTSKSVQQQLGVDQPDYGILFNDMEVLNGQSISMKNLMQPKAESEIAFVLSEDLDYPNLTVVDLLSAIDYALPAIEIVGSRIENWNIKIVDTIADNASASHFVVGHTPRTLDEFDMINCKMQMTKNGELASKGSGADCLGSPLNALLWLANKMVEIGHPLEAGELIFTGALGPMVKVEAGDLFKAEIEGLGTVSISFEA